MNKEKLDKIFGGVALIALIASAVLTFSNSYVAKSINLWQASINDGKYYPVLTMFILVLPFLLVMLPLKIILIKKLKKATG